MRLTDAQIRCLLALLSLTRLGGEIASKDVSTVLGVSRPSVHRMLENLGNSGLTEKKPYGAVKLTEGGAASGGGTGGAARPAIAALRPPLRPFHG